MNGSSHPRTGGTGRNSDPNPTFAYYRNTGYDKRTLLCVVLGENFPWSDFRCPPYADVKRGRRKFKPTKRMLIEEVQRRIEIQHGQHQIIGLLQGADLNRLAKLLTKNPVCTVWERNYFDMEIEYFVETLKPRPLQRSTDFPLDYLNRNLVPECDSCDFRQIPTAATVSSLGEGTELKVDFQNRESHSKKTHSSDNSSENNPSSSNISVTTSGRKRAKVSSCDKEIRNAVVDIVMFESQNAKDSVRARIASAQQEHDEASRLKRILAMAEGLKEKPPMNPRLCKLSTSTKRHLYEEALRRYRHMQLLPDDAPKWNSWTKSNLKSWLQQHPIIDSESLVVLWNELEFHFGSYPIPAAAAAAAAAVVVVVVVVVVGKTVNS